MKAKYMATQAALKATMRAEKLSFTQVAIMCGVTENAVRSWDNGTKQMSGPSVLALQRTSPTFRKLTLEEAA